MVKDLLAFASVSLAGTMVTIDTRRRELTARSRHADQLPYADGKGSLPHYFPKIKTAFYLLFRLRFGDIVRKVRRRIHSRTLSYGLRRDLLVAFEPAPAKIPITIRPLVGSDIPQLLGAPRSGNGGHESVEDAERISFLRDNIPTCYVAVTEDDTPCYMQWLMSSEYNDSIQIRFNRVFPLLAPDEALLEDAFTPVAYRGMGIMSHAMALIANQAQAFQARWVITFVEQDNVASLKGCKKAGFVPYVLRDDRWLLFTRKLTWTLLPEGSLYPYEAAQQSGIGPRSVDVPTISPRE
jgi:hypothetical protein